MNRLSFLGLSATMVFGFALAPGDAVAQTTKDIVGTWKQITNVNIGPDGRRSDTFGANPNAVVMFDASGRFVSVTTRPDLPKFASNNRMQGTAEENKAIVQGSIAYFGTYSVVDKVIIEKVEGGTWPSWTGTDQKRPIVSFTGDDMTLAVPTASVGGTGEVTYKRVK
jgi:Lipocalin-like domain